MDNVNLSLSFIALCALCGAALVYAVENRAGKKASPVYVGGLIWLSLQAFLSIRGFYLEDSSFPRILLALVPAVFAILFIAYSGMYKEFRDNIPLRWLILFQAVRIPVEVLRHFYNENGGAVPTIMTWEGRNWDIFAGLTAILVFWLYKEKRISKSVVLIWNFAALLLMINAVFLSVFSTPSDWQLFAQDAPNREVLEFPLIWLPAFIIPLELLSHLISIQKIMKPALKPRKKRFN